MIKKFSQKKCNVYKSQFQRISANAYHNISGFHIEIPVIILKGYDIHLKC